MSLTEDRGTWTESPADKGRGRKKWVLEEIFVFVQVRLRVICARESEGKYRLSPKRFKGKVPWRDFHNVSPSNPRLKATTPIYHRATAS